MAAFVAFHMGDYEKHTRDLTMLEDGAYMRLLRYVWSTGNAIATASACAVDDAAAYAVAYRIAYAVDDAERNAVQKVLKKYFTFSKNEWTHQRATLEYQKACKKSKASSDKAKKRWGNDAAAYAVDDADTMPQHMPQLCNLDLDKDSSNKDLSNKYTHTLEAHPLEKDECVSEFENSIEEPITISVETMKADHSLPEPQTDLEISARNGLLYAKGSNNPNFCQMDWIEGFLKIQIPAIQTERPEIPAGEIDRMWRDTIDVMAGRANGHTNFAKVTFSNMVRDWSPKQKTPAKASTEKIGSSFVSHVDKACQMWKDGKVLGHIARCISFRPDQLEWDDDQKLFNIKGTTSFLTPASLRIADPSDKPFEISAL